MTDSIPRQAQPVRFTGRHRAAAELILAQFPPGAFRTEFDAETDALTWHPAPSWPLSSGEMEMRRVLLSLRGQGAVVLDDTVRLLDRDCLARVLDAVRIVAGIDVAQVRS